MPRQVSPYPFNALEREYVAALRRIPTRDLVAEIEAAQWLRIDLTGEPGDSAAVAKLQLDTLTAELARRQRLVNAHPATTPAWPKRERDLRARVDAVKDRWPIDVFCEHLLAARLRHYGGGRFKAECPLPGHNDKTASFVVFPDGHAWCFGCNRGGDVIKLAQYALGCDRFYDALERLEVEAGIAA